MIIDAHHHFWRYDPREYGWISDRMPILRRDFLPADLLAETRAVGVDGVISVQARQTLAETDWLLDLADANPFIRAVVGWVPLASPTVAADLERLAARAKLKAVRHVLQDEPDNRHCLRDDFNRGIAELKRFDLVYDILIFERQLGPAIELVDRHPQQRFVLDHIAKPAIAAGASIDGWRANLRELARRPNVYCKLSGVATEADWRTWNEAQLRPYADAALDAFGPRRLMFGSDWPVCLVATGYQRWFDFVSTVVGQLSTAERVRVMGHTAAEAYNLDQS